MASNEPPGQSDRPSGAADDALRRLEARLDAASQAAERLLADAAARATRTPPPSGWQQPRPEGEEAADGGLLGGDSELLMALVASLRDRIPPDLQQRLADAVREVLLALRALIDWYLERTERRAAEPTQVQDIPIL